jgi:hypothetical protein
LVLDPLNNLNMQLEDARVGFGMIRINKQENGIEVAGL